MPTTTRSGSDGTIKALYDATKAQHDATLAVLAKTASETLGVGKPADAGSLDPAVTMTANR